MRGEKRALLITLSEKELQELIRILLDRDEQAALVFLERYVRPAAHTALDGG